jgi:hypothetical protein
MVDIHNITDEEIAKFIQGSVIIHYANTIANDYDFGAMIRKYIVEQKEIAYIESYNYGEWANTPEKYKLLCEQIKIIENNNK